MQNQSVLQGWVTRIPFMQQSVLIAAMRGPDGVNKDHPSKKLCRYLRRCIVLSAFDKVALLHPGDQRGGSYTGPSIPVATDAWENAMQDGPVKAFLDSIDSLPHHFTLHFIHAAEIIAYKHDDRRVSDFWRTTYYRFCHDMHMRPEGESALDARLNDDEKAWRNDTSRFKA